MPNQQEATNDFSVHSSHGKRLQFAPRSSVEYYSHFGNNKAHYYSASISKFEYPLRDTWDASHHVAQLQHRDIAFWQDVEIPLPDHNVHNAVVHRTDKTRWLRTITHRLPLLTTPWNTA